MTGQPLVEGALPVELDPLAVVLEPDGGVEVDPLAAASVPLAALPLAPEEVASVLADPEPEPDDVVPEGVEDAVPD